MTAPTQLMQNDNQTRCCSTRCDGTPSRPPRSGYGPRGRDVLARRLALTLPILEPETITFELVVPPDCGHPAQQFILSGVSVSLEWNTTAPPFSPGGVWLNATAPPPYENYSYFTTYANYFTNVNSGSFFGFTHTVGGMYSFTACAVGGAPSNPTFLNGTYVEAPVV
jgi:hypothetical protein